MAYDDEWLGLLKAYDWLGPNVSNGIANPYQGLGDKPADPTQRWPHTCGYGHLMSLEEETNGVSINGVMVDVMHKGLTMQQCDDLLAQDLAPRIETVSSSLDNLSDNEFGAFLDLVFNSGNGCLTGQPGTYHEEGNKIQAAHTMLLYINAQGKPLLGLWRRRLSDAIYYLGGPVMVANSVPSETSAKAKLESLLGFAITKPAVLY